MKYKKTIIISVIVLAISFVLIALFNSTYALFSVDDYGDNPNSYSTGMLDIQAISKSENISLTNALPMTDEDGLETTPYVFTIKNTGNLDYKFSIKLLSTGTSDTTFSSQYIKLQVDDGDVLTLSELTNSIIKKDITLPVGESIDISLRIWLSIETPNTELGKSFNSKIVTDGQAVYTNTSYTPLSDFTYYLGSEYSTVESLAASDVAYFDGPSDFKLAPISLEENEVLLVRYKGESTDVAVPDTYNVDGVNYNVVLLSSAWYHDGIRSSYGETGVFTFNENIKNVYFYDNVKFISSYRGITDINPDGTASLTENTMNGAFMDCKSLLNVPIIPDSVTNMVATFEGCTSLVNAPVIPNYVTNMNSTFYGCTSLTGTVRINSNKVSDIAYIFDNTSKAITVEVPAGSTTYKNISALTTSNGMPSNVTLSVVYPSEATPLSDFTYYLGSEYSTVETAPYIESESFNTELKLVPISLEENEVLLVRYNGDSKDVVVPSTYNVAGVNYNVTILSQAEYYEGDAYAEGGTFNYNDNIESVFLANDIKFIRSYHFEEEGYMTLLENAADYLFYQCDNLINVPVIPYSVTSLEGTFDGCDNLTGTIRINSSNITEAAIAFDRTVKAITVEVPTGSTTYTTIGSSGLPSNVTLKTY